MREHFRAVWMFYVMEAGPTIHHFTSELFKTVRHYNYINIPVDLIDSIPFSLSDTEQ